MIFKAPDVDENGKIINPHNPEFITKVPWYLGDSGPTLKHHSIQKNENFLTVAESDKIISQKIALQKQVQQQYVKPVYRKGACKNCGSMTHKEKDCVERPRSSKKAAWKSGMDIAPDDVVVNLEDHGKVAYDAKRDSWQGYDPAAYQDIIEKFNRVEEERKKYRQEMKEKKRREMEEQKRAKKDNRKQRKSEHDGDCEHESGDSDSDYDSDEDDDDDEGDARGDFLNKDENQRDFQYQFARQGGVGGAEMKLTSRNLRIREDTSKYLLNLNMDSAFYDPKSRSMRENPLPDANPEEQVYAGDNFTRYSGDALKIAQNQVLCWEMQARGEGIDLISNPSQAELMQRQFLEKKKALDEAKKKAIAEKYGVDGSSKERLDPRLLLGQTEAYVEFSRDGQIIKGLPKIAARTKYEEDVFVNNHTSVWGSFFHRGRRCWGYACCHALTKNSYCTGETGRAANDAANTQAADAQHARKMLETIKDKEKEREKAKENNTSTSRPIAKRSELYGEVEADKVELDERKLQDAIARQEQWARDVADKEVLDDRKRSYNSTKSIDVSREDMEAYRLKKVKRDDPMAQFMDSEELLEK